jgi:type IX secretion system PorP/SprF family membrane protein
MKKISLLLIFITILTVKDMSAQQDPQYTQYMYNMNIMNPAYAGSKESLSITALYRTQWAGLDGAPETITLSAHAPVGERVGLGLSAIKERLYRLFLYPAHGRKFEVGFRYQRGSHFSRCGLNLS